MGLSDKKKLVRKCLSSKAHQRTDEAMPVSLTVLHSSAMVLFSIESGFPTGEESHEAFPE
jgi:hypothetical protein